MNSLQKTTSRLWLYYSANADSNTNLNTKRIPNAATALSTFIKAKTSAFIPKRPKAFNNTKPQALYN